jgi:hypothetical protein
MSLMLAIGDIVRVCPCFTALRMDARLPLRDRYAVLVVIVIHGVVLEWLVGTVRACGLKLVHDV